MLQLLSLAVRVVRVAPAPDVAKKSSLIRLSPGKTRRTTSLAQMAKELLGDPDCGCRLLRYRLQRQSTAGAAPSLCTNQTGQNYLSMAVFIHTNKDAHQTWLGDFLSSNITISGGRRRINARSDHQPEIQMHNDAHSPRERVRRDNESQIGNGPGHLN